MKKNTLFLIIGFVLGILVLAVPYVALLITDWHETYTPFERFDIRDKGYTYKILDGEGDPSKPPGFYQLEVIRNGEETQQVPIIDAPKPLNEFVNKNVNIEVKWVLGTGTPKQCRKGWEKWCTFPSTQNTTELYITKIELAK